MTYWSGSHNCDVCGSECGNTLYDFKVPDLGSWAVACPYCFNMEGGRLGTGFGQKYQKNEEGKYIKVEG